MILLKYIAIPLNFFARAGGGGSSSGGGAGGGSLIVLLGYIPMHIVGAFLRRKTINKQFWLISQIVAWLFCISCCVLLSFFGYVGLTIAAGALLGMSVGLYDLASKLKRNKKVTQKLQQSAQLDPVWDEQAILIRAREVFIAYQTDWTNRDFRAMANYMTPEYHQHASLMVAALKQAKRLNNVHNPTINEMMVVDLLDSKQNTEDTVTVGITAQADDLLIDELTNTTLYKDTSPFTEYWSFNRKNNTWLLSGIEQATQDLRKADTSLQQLARRKGFFYSLDWGWLLIPKRGWLFRGAKFGVSDINNHIIGIYNTYLLQLYTYDPVPRSSGSYLIAQTNVPKVYGNIVVRRKKWTNLSKPKGLTKISMEWSDFNKKYDVFASNYEGATSFELLHPAFMEKIEALTFEVNIEVVDNIVYLYSSQKTEKNSTEDYQKMLDILQEAYKQMKM